MPGPKRLQEIGLIPAQRSQFRFHADQPFADPMQFLGVIAGETIHDEGPGEIARTGATTTSTRFQQAPTMSVESESDGVSELVHGVCAVRSHQYYIRRICTSPYVYDSKTDISPLPTDSYVRGVSIKGASGVQW